MNHLLEELSKSERDAFIGIGRIAFLESPAIGLDELNVVGDDLE